MVKLFAVHMPDEVDQRLLATVHSGYVGQGPRVEEFEAALAARIGSGHVVAVSSCTAALHLALRLAGLDGSCTGSTPEVITTPMTCSATTTAILAAGGKPVWADVDQSTGLIDPIDVQAKIGPNTKAIMCVDWGGNPCDMMALTRIAANAGIPLIEDAAHAFGATYHGRHVGNGTATFTCFSFQAIKLITTGDGGALVCETTEAWKRSRRLRWFGVDRDTDKELRGEQDLEEWGYKFQMNDIAATIGLAQMSHVDRLLRRHRDNARVYRSSLDSKYFEPGAMPTPDHNPSYWLYTVLLPDSDERTAFVKYMAEAGIQVAAVHRRNDTLRAFAEFRQGELVGVAEFDRRQVNLPVHWALTSEQVDLIVKACNAFAHSRLVAGGS